MYCSWWSSFMLLLDLWMFNFRSFFIPWILIKFAQLENFCLNFVPMLRTSAYSTSVGTAVTVCGFDVVCAVTYLIMNGHLNLPEWLLLYLDIWNCLCLYCLILLAVYILHYFRCVWSCTQNVYTVLNRPTCICEHVHARKLLYQWWHMYSVLLLSFWYLV